jgi:hypothetical protein
MPADQLVSWLTNLGPEWNGALPEGLTPDRV